MTFIKYAKVKIGKSNHLNDLHKVCQGQKIGKSNNLNDLHKVCHSQKIGKSNYLKGFVGKKIKGSKQDKTKFVKVSNVWSKLFF